MDPSSSSSRSSSRSSSKSSSKSSASITVTILGGIGQVVSGAAGAAGGPPSKLLPAAVAIALAVALATISLAQLLMSLAVLIAVLALVAVVGVGLWVWVSKAREGATPLGDHSPGWSVTTAPHRLAGQPCSLCPIKIPGAAVAMITGPSRAQFWVCTGHHLLIAATGIEVVLGALRQALPKESSR